MSATRCSPDAAERRLFAVTDKTPDDALRHLYVERQMGIGDIARYIGVGHRTIRLLLDRHRIPRRTFAEQRALDVSRMSHADRLAVTSASRAIIKGRPKSHEDLCKRARTKQQTIAMSIDEMDIMHALTDAGLFPVYSYAIDKYNIDFAFPALKLAIEYNGGNWHNTTKKREQDEAKRVFLQSRGWWVMTFLRLDRPRKSRTDAGNESIPVAELVRQVREAVHWLNPRLEAC